MLIFSDRLLFQLTSEEQKPSLRTPRTWKQFSKIRGVRISGFRHSRVRVIERWAAHLHKAGYSPASIRRKMVVLKVVLLLLGPTGGDLPESPFWRVEN